MHIAQKLDTFVHVASFQQRQEPVVRIVCFTSKVESSSNIDFRLQGTTKFVQAIYIIWAKIKINKHSCLFSL